MKRRDFFKLCSSTALILSASTLPSFSQSHNLADIERAYDALVAQKNPSIFCFLDDDHNDFSLIEGLGDPSHLRLLQAHGVTQLFVEYPKNLYPVIASIANYDMPFGALTSLLNAALHDASDQLVHDGYEALSPEIMQVKRSYLINRSAALIRLARNAYEKGISVHFTDGQTLSEHIVIGSVIQQDPARGIRLIRDRILQYDPVIAQQIDDVLKHTGGKAALFFGSLHIGLDFGQAKIKNGNIDDALRLKGYRTSIVMLNNHREPRSIRVALSQVGRKASASHIMGDNVNIEEFDIIYNTQSGQVSLAPQLQEVAFMQRRRPLKPLR